MVGLFFAGGVVGAIGFKPVGLKSTLVLAAMLLILAAVPLADDIADTVRGNSHRND